MTRTATLIFFLLFCLSPCFGQKEKFVESRDRALTFLLSQQRTDGSFADSTNPLFNVWETILVTDALLTLNRPDCEPAIANALQFLKGSENEQGLICHNSKCKAATCVETSAYYVQLISDDSLSEVSHKLELLSNLQNPNGSWFVLNPDVHERTDFVSITAFAVNLFELHSYPNYNKKAALDFIASQQLPDGSWGQTWEYYNVPGYALWQCLKALKNEPQFAQNYQRGLDFILQSQSEDGSWFFRDPAIPNFTSAELQTALMLQCLEDETDPKTVEARDKALHFLLEKQLANGSFDGGNFPIQNARYKKAEYLFATAMAIKALQMKLNLEEQ